MLSLGFDTNQHIFLDLKKHCIFYHEESKRDDGNGKTMGASRDQEGIVSFVNELKHKPTLANTTQNVIVLTFHCTS